MLFLIINEYLASNFKAGPIKSDGEYKTKNNRNLTITHDQIEGENPFEKSSKILTEWTNEEFLRYLDTNFKSEINLAIDDKSQLFMASSAKVSKKEDMVVEDVNLAYRGQKHMFKKGKNADRYDVLFKTFIRAVRRYLWELFEKDFDVSLFQNKKISEKYRQFVIKFYDKYFKQYSCAKDVPIDETGNIYFIFGIFLSNKCSFPFKSDRQRKFKIFFESVCLKFSKARSQRFLLWENISEFFKMLLNSGFINSMIDVYPKLLEAKDLYLTTAKTMAGI